MRVMSSSIADASRVTRSMLFIGYSPYHRPLAVTCQAL
jgi:hypothetical protein